MENKLGGGGGSGFRDGLRSGVFRLGLAALLGFELRLGLRNGLANGGENYAHRTDGVVVAGNGIVGEIGIAVGVHEGDHGNLELAGLGLGGAFVGDDDREKRRGRLQPERARERLPLENEFPRRRVAVAVAANVTGWPSSPGSVWAMTI